MGSLIVFAALALAGVVAVALAWRGAARTGDVAEQLAFIVSGGLGGLALTGFGLAVFSIQLGRIRARAELDEVELVLRAVACVADARIRKQREET